MSLLYDGFNEYPQIPYTYSTQMYTCVVYSSQPENSLDAPPGAAYLSCERRLSSLMASTQVAVALRTRPLSEKERHGGANRCIRFVDKQQVIIGKDRAFTYDYAFDESTSNEIIYQLCVQKLLDGIFQGYNAAVFAYGQTGAGKTFTMGSGLNGGTAHTRGIIPRVIEDLFRRVNNTTAAQVIAKALLYGLCSDHLCIGLCAGFLPGDLQ